MEQYPAKFQTSDGKDWTLVLTIGLVRRLKTIGVDFGGLETGDQFIAIVGDPLTFADVLWILCESAAQSRDIDRDAFEESLGGDSLSQAETAFRGAVVNFIHDPQRKAVVAKVLEKAHEAKVKIVEAATAMISGEQGEEMMDKVVGDATAKMEQVLVSGGLLPDSKPSQETTPGN